MREHVTLELKGIDRLYRARAAVRSGVAAFFCKHRGHSYASLALMDPISKAFVEAIHAFQAHSVQF